MGKWERHIFNAVVWIVILMVLCIAIEKAIWIVLVAIWEYIIKPFLWAIIIVVLVISAKNSRPKG